MSNEVVVSDRKALIAEAFDYRRQGASYSEIAKEMKITETEARSLVGEYVAETLDFADGPEVIRKLDLSRIEMGISGIAQQVAAGDQEAIRTMIALMEKREKIEAKGPVRAVDLFR